MKIINEIINEINEEDEDFKYVLKQAKENLKKDGELIPILFTFEGKSKTACIGFANMPESFEERQKMFYSAATMLYKESKNIDRIIFAMEAWISTAGPEEKNIPRPSEDPKRKEVLVISNNYSNGRGYSFMRYFKKDKDNNIKWGKTIKTNGVQSPLLNAFWKGYGNIKNI